jgi:hypothetical protein
MRSAAAATVVLAMIALLSAAPAASAQATRPATRPAAAGGRSAEDMLNQMLQPSGDATARPVDPSAHAGAVDATSGSGAVVPNAPQVTVMRERSFIVDRTGRLVRSEDGQQWEFRFEADGKALRDPPVIVLPNLTLMSMENEVGGTSRELRFRITGEVTEYRGRNYVLLRKAIVVPEAAKQF